jgi:hypothetical protein
MRLSGLCMALSSCPLLLAGCLHFDPEPPTLDYGEVVVGNESIVRPAAWKNSDTGSAYIDGIAITGPFHQVYGPARDHKVRAGQTSDPFGIVFRPRQEGPVAERAVPYAFAGIDVGVDVRLVGAGVLPVVPESGYLSGLKAGVPAIADLDFGDVVVKHSSYRTLTLRNTGPNDRPLTLTFTQTMKAFDAASTATATSPIANVLVPGNSRVTIVLSFTPAAEGAHAGSLSIHSGKANLAGSAHVLLWLRGRGLKG